MKPLAAAFGFLSMIPLPARWQSEAALARSLPYFPIVGFVFGAAVALLDFAFVHALPPAPAAALLVIALALMSGGLHIDGLADTADGFFSSRPKERILEIMRDSRTGAMGAAAVTCVLMLKCLAIAALPASVSIRAAFLMPLAGRCAIVLGMAGLPYVRQGGGLASVFGEARWRHAIWTVFVLAAASWFAAGWRGLAAAALSVLTTGLVSLWCHRKIGGYTGDTLGATCELAEAVPPLVFACQLWPGVAS